MKVNRMKDALDQIARRAVPEDMNLMPAIMARLERRSFMATLRTRPVLMILLVLLALVLLSGVAYAIGKATGYIPGIGLVDQSGALRVLAEPVTVTRDGITLTVEQVVLSADKTVVVYKVEGIPADAYEGEGNGDDDSSHSSSITVPIEGTHTETYSRVENKEPCFAGEHLSLSDGTTLPMQEGFGNGWSSGFENRYVFGPVPADVNDATFFIPCIEGMIPGKLPENWEIPLQFIPVPPDMNILPVVDIKTPETNKSQSAMMLEQIIETNDGYIVTGKFQSTGLPFNAKALGSSEWITVTDANGQIVEALLPESLGLASNIYGEFYWAYEIRGKQHAFPLIFTLKAVSADIPDATVEFDFDTGSDPKVGQVWNLNKELEIAGYKIKVVSIKRLEKGYSFIFKADPDVISVHAEVNHVPFSRATGGSDGYGKGDLFYVIEYDGEIPSGNLTIQLNWLQAKIHGPWQVQWSPENVLPTP